MALAVEKLQMAKASLIRLFSVGLAVLVLLVLLWRAFPYAQPRLSGNCGPAAQGLTPDGDVVPIKVDRGGYVLLSVPPAREHP